MPMFVSDRKELFKRFYVDVESNKRNEMIREAFAEVSKYVAKNGAEEGPSNNDTFEDRRQMETEVEEVEEENLGFGEDCEETSLSDNEETKSVGEDSRCTCNSYNG